MFVSHHEVHVTGPEILIVPIHAFEGTFNSHPIAFDAIYVFSHHKIDEILDVVHHEI